MKTVIAIENHYRKSLKFVNLRRVFVENVLEFVKKKYNKVKRKKEWNVHNYDTMKYIFS